MMRGLALALVVLPSLALADPTPKEQQKARDLVKQAIAKSQAGEHQAAVELYDDAYKIIPQPLLLSNIGSEYQQMEHKEVEALGFFCKYLAADPNGTNVGFATAQAKTLYIKLGGVTDVKDEDVCKPIQKPAPLVEAKPDPTPIDTTPTPTTQPAEPAPEGGTKTSPMRYVGVAVAAAGVGMFGFGVYEGLQAKSISDEITNHPMDVPWDANIKNREQEGKDAEKKQIIFMAAGGGALALGAVMFFVFAPKTASEHAVAITPTANGFAAVGRF